MTPIPIDQIETFFEKNNLHNSYFIEKLISCIQTFNREDNSNINEKWLQEIFYGYLELGLGPNVVEFADPAFTHEQLRELMLGAVEEINYEVYKDKNIPSGIMKKIREKSKDKKHESCIQKLRLKQQQIIRKCTIEKIPIEPYIDIRYDCDQYSEIEKGLREKINIKTYANPKWDHNIMALDRFAKKYGVDDLLSEVSPLEDFKNIFYKLIKKIMSKMEKDITTVVNDENIRKEERLNQIKKIIMKN
jgi:hypothetical protein